MRSSPEVAEKFRSLHRPESGILVCPAAWDAASARVFQECGARAIVTSSLGVANTLGYPDGEAFLPGEETLRMASRIVAVVGVPVSVDMEAGYGDPAAMAEALIDAGVVGVNIEDRIGDEPAPRALDEAAARVAEVREAADRADFPLFINARTDTLHLGGDLDDAVERLNAYLGAGAECALPILPPELKNEATITELVARVNGPLNIAAHSGRPNVRDLDRLGVRRVSISVSRAIHGFVRTVAQQLLGEGTFDLMDAQQPFPNVNEAFKEAAWR